MLHRFAFALYAHQANLTGRTVLQGRSQGRAWMIMECIDWIEKLDSDPCGHARTCVPDSGLGEERCSSYAPLEVT